MTTKAASCFKIIPRQDINYVLISDFDLARDFGARRQAWRDYLKFMAWLEAEGFEGWYSEIDAENVTLRAFLNKIGAVEYGRDENKIFVRRLARGVHGKIGQLVG